jgi:ceramide glucosyltransferase
MPSALTAVAVLCALLALAGAAYFALAMVAAQRFQRQRSHPSGMRFTPPVSILRSLKGLDPHMYAAFRSHCLLEYPEYEVLFGADDPSEPSLALVEKLREEFPLVNLRIVQCPLRLGMNGKVSNLAQMLPQARYDYVVINDSDILVPRDYLQQVLASLAQPGVGMVTTLYRGLAGATLWSKLEALGLSTDFSAGVLVARLIERGIRFGLGATMATTRTVLRKVGGLEPLVDYLGDDYELGARTAAAGYKVELANIVVETALPDYSFRDFWAHQLRWARNVKDRRRAQYFGLIVSFGLIWALLAVAAAPWTWWTWLVLGVTAALRFTSAVIIGRRVLADPQLLMDLWLLPLRDGLALAVWLVSFFGNEVEWRGLRFKLRKGRLERT